jgi:hypothetical protein
MSMVPAYAPVAVSVPISEAQVLRGCLRAAKQLSVPCRRNNTGAATYGSGGAARFVRYGEPGASDILGSLAMPAGHNPPQRRICVEAKRPSSPGRRAGKLTQVQWEYLKRARDEGAVAIVVWSVDQFTHAIITLKSDPHAVFDLPPEPKAAQAKRAKAKKSLKS